MTNIETKKTEALKILTAIGIPVSSYTERRQERLALALLAVANINPDMPWEEASVFETENSWALSTREIIEYWNKHYNENISPGSYDDVRRKDLIILIEAGIVQRSVQDPLASTNNPQRRYAVIPEAGNLLRKLGEEDWNDAVTKYQTKFGSFVDRIERTRNYNKLRVTISSGNVLELGPGEHNVLQKAIIEEMLPRFAPSSELLYVGDTSNKMLLIERDRLKELGFSEFSHETLPDVVAYDKKANLIFMIEAVYSSNPVSKLRHLNLERFTSKCISPRIYVSVFKDKKALATWLTEISWETEVWLSDTPDHMIHFDGKHYLTPYE